MRSDDDIDDNIGVEGYQEGHSRFVCLCVSAFNQRVRGAEEEERNRGRGEGDADERGVL